LPIWDREHIRVVDAGCGKAYMSLALVAYGREVGTRVELVGIDVNPSVIETVREVASSLGYDEARFEVSTIADYASEEPIDLLVSLHACDTATDEAIAAGLRAARLEIAGYRVEVMEFVSAEHTAKNVMLRAERAPSQPRASRAAAEFVELRDRYGVDPAIERILPLP
jgi:hypothetical protein